MDQEYTSGELMAAILSLQEATALGFQRVDHRFEEMEAKLTGMMDRRFQEFEFRMNKRFDSVDLRFDAFEKRVAILEERTEHLAG